jgi:hypothetical protein
LAKQTTSVEAVATLHYLEQMWILIAELTLTIKGNGSRSAPGSALHFSAPD